MIEIWKDLDETRFDNWEQGSVPKTNIPDSYITYWENTSFDNLNADNQTKEIAYPFTVIYYTKDWDNIYSDFEEIVSLLKSKNYIASGMGFPLESDNPEYRARGIEVQKIERRN